MYMEQDSETLNFRNQIIDIQKKQLDVLIKLLGTMQNLRRDMQSNHVENLRIKTQAKESD
jgi:hypothetical protein